MKKTFLLILLPALFFPFNCKAQNLSPDGWNIDAGLRFGLPIRYLGMVSSFGVGVDGSITKPVVDGLSLGGRVNASYFFGTTDEIGISHSGSRVFSVLGDANYLFPQKVFVGVDLGLGFGDDAGFVNTELADIFSVGYQFDYNKHVFRLSLDFEQTTYQKSWGLTAKFRL
jgi:hypothetical protein